MKINIICQYYPPETGTTQELTLIIKVEKKKL